MCVCLQCEIRIKAFHSIITYINSSLPRFYGIEFELRGVVLLFTQTFHLVPHPSNYSLSRPFIHLPISLLPIHPSAIHYPSTPLIHHSFLQPVFHPSASSLIQPPIPLSIHHPEDVVAAAKARLPSPLPGHPSVALSLIMTFLTTRFGVEGEAARVVALGHFCLFRCFFVFFFRF